MTKLYEVYLTDSGNYSPRTVDYAGTIHAVAAASLSQAQHFASRDIWASDPDSPAGIVWVYRKEAGAPGDTWLWTGERRYGPQFPRHGAGKRALIEAMRKVAP